MKFYKGQFVLFDGLPAVVVGLEDDLKGFVSEDHVGLWFGDPQVKRKSEGWPREVKPEIWTVPKEYCEPIKEVEYKH